MKILVREERKMTSISKRGDDFVAGDYSDGVIEVNLDNISFIFSILLIGYCFSLFILVIEKVVVSVGN